MTLPQSRVRRARRVLVAGNGGEGRGGAVPCMTSVQGIAMELVHEIRDCEVEQGLRERKRMSRAARSCGRCAIITSGILSSTRCAPLRCPRLIPPQEAGRWMFPTLSDRLVQELSTLHQPPPRREEETGAERVQESVGKERGSSLGPQELVSKSSGIALDANDAIIVGRDMSSSMRDVFAAGDVCSIQLDSCDQGNEGGSWFQMRLWSQARQQGMWAAYCMVGRADPLRSPFDLFAHATYFFGYKVVLLGRYNGQGLDKGSSHFRVLKREQAGQEFVRVILFEGRIEGAVLFGDTDLEETFENLILNRLDVSFLGDRLLDPSLDLEDFFD
eukprot:746286-Hanusia_phi.AAC.2